MKPPIVWQLEIFQWLDRKDLGLSHDSCGSDENYDVPALDGLVLNWLNPLAPPQDTFEVHTHFCAISCG